MSVDPPGWVRDAIFYQVFPDRFASSERVHKPGPLEPWDAPPTAHGFKGGDLLGIAEHLGYLEDLGINALYLTPDLRVGIEPPLPHVRLLRGRPAAGRRRRPARAARRRSRARDPGRARWRVQPHRPRLLAVPPRPRGGRRVALRDWFHLDDARLDAGQPLDAYPPPGSPPGTLGYAAWWGLPALPKLNTDEPEVREYLFGVAEHWLRFGIDGWRLDVPGRDRRRGLLAGVPGALPGRPPGCLPRRRDLAGGARTGCAATGSTP